jgi:hypothetical protein
MTGTRSGFVLNIETLPVDEEGDPWSREMVEAVKRVYE